MVLEPVILAKELASFLAPYLPDLVKMGEKATDEVGKKIGGDAWENAKTFWGRLRPKVESKPAAQEAVKDVVSSPKDEDAQAALRVQLKKILAEDEHLASDLGRMWDEAKSIGVMAVASGDRSVAVGGNVSGSVIVTGDHNQVR